MLHKLTLLGLAIATSYGWSTFDKTDKSYTKNKLENSVDYAYYKNAAKPFKECKDKYESICRKALEIGYDKFCNTPEFEGYNVYCKRTCGHCPAVSPLSCHASADGCCWDNITKVSSGCPDCIDRTTTCHKIASMCHQAHLTRACPQTCKICPANPYCNDDPHQTEWCPLWKQAGMCEIDKELMTQYCPKTCNLCPSLQGNAIGNKVVEVFRKGTAEMLDLPEDKRLASEKELINILLKDNEKRQTKDGDSNQVLVHQKKSIGIPKDVSEEKIRVAKKEAMSDEAFNALAKLISTKSQNQKRDAGKVANFESFDALNRLVIEKMAKESLLQKKEVANQMSEESFKALIKLMVSDKEKRKRESTTKMISSESFNALNRQKESKKSKEKKETSKTNAASLDALNQLLKQQNSKKEASQQTPPVTIKTLEVLLEVLDKKEVKAKKEVVSDNEIDQLVKLLTSDSKVAKKSVDDAELKKKKADKALIKLLFQDTQKSNKESKKSIELNNEQLDSKKLDQKIIDDLLFKLISAENGDVQKHIEAVPASVAKKETAGSAAKKEVDAAKKQEAMNHLADLARKDKREKEFLAKNNMQPMKH